MKYLLNLFLLLAWAGSADAQYVYVYVYGAGTGGGGCCPTPTPAPPSPTPSLYRPAYSYAPSGGCNGNGGGGCNGHQAGQRMPAAPVQYAPPAPQVGEYQTPAAIQYAPQYAPQPELAQPDPADQTQVAALLRSYQAAPRPVYQAAPAVAYAPAVATYASAPVVYAQPAVGTYAAALPRAPVVAGPRFRRGVSYGSAHTAAGNYGGGFSRAVVCGPGG